MEIPLLTSGESKVYQALVELGESSIGQILKLSGVSHSKIYDILKRLAEKGLVSSINKNGKQFFSASEPERLSELIREEAEKIETEKDQMKTIIQQLQIRKKVSTPLSVLSSYEGFKGMKTVLESVLQKLGKNEPVFILGSPKEIGEYASGYLKEWQKERIRIGAICKIISDIDAPSWEEDWWEKSKKNKMTFTKRSSSVSPAYFVITKKSVATINFSTKILSFIIDHPEIAKKYQQFFEEVWKSAK